MPKFWTLSHLKNRKVHTVSDEILQKLKANNHLRFYSTPVPADAPAMKAEYVPEEVKSMESLKKTGSEKAPEMIIGSKEKIVDPAKTDPGNKTQPPISKDADKK